jgi:ABC-type uncharacterized transport system substrate-binding protein
MKRRAYPRLAFIAFLLIATLGADAGWAQTKILRVGLLNPTYQVPEPSSRAQEPFFRTLREHGWDEGNNVVFEFRGFGADPTRMAELAEELVRLKVDVLLAVGPTSVRAAFAATQAIPIVAHDLETDPVAAGYAGSYGDPGGNLTGLFLDSPDVAGKWLQMLKAMVPTYPASSYSGTRPRGTTRWMPCARLRLR